MIEVGSKWRHSKTCGIYEVIAVAREEGTGGKLVIYRNVESEEVWARPFEEWEQQVNGPYGLIPRFERLVSKRSESGDG